jgi:hypothetical protein
MSSSKITNIFLDKRLSKQVMQRRPVKAHVYWNDRNIMPVGHSVFR